jgi:hypothetical protein
MQKQIINQIFKHAEKFETTKDLIADNICSLDTDDAKIKFLNNLETEAQIEFSKIKTSIEGSAISKLQNIYTNLQIQIKNFRRSIVIDKKISFLLNENKHFERYVSWFEKKLTITLAFIDKENFIMSEIRRISEEFINPLDVHIGPGWQVTSRINYTEYKKYGYQWLMSGNDLLIHEIIEGAKQNYLSSGGIIHDQSEFANAIIENLIDGVAFVRYEKYLRDELKKIKTENNTTINATNLLIGNNYGELAQSKYSLHVRQKNKFSKNQKDSSKKGWLFHFFSNPWVITVIGGLLIAFFAKLFGWV